MSDGKAITKRETNEAIAMLRDEDIFGRLSHGPDMDEFDAMWPLITDTTGPEGASGDELDLHAGGMEIVDDPGAENDPPEAQMVVEEAVDKVEGADEFETPVEVFPMFKKALQHFQSAEPSARAVRVDTPETYTDLVAQSAVKEMQRRLNELRAVVEAHAADGHGVSAVPIRKWDDVIGAIDCVTSLKGAETAEEAAAALPAVPLDLPDFADGKVKCWRDGSNVIVSLHFADANGNHKIVTSGAKSKASFDEVADRVRGMDRLEVLGALPTIAAQVTGQKLVKDLARAALAARESEDVLGMSDQPLMRVSGIEGGSAPLAALMYVQQQAEEGDPQAAREMLIIKAAAETDSGQQVAVPMLVESSKRLARGRAQKVLSGGVRPSGARRFGFRGNAALYV